jgi:hypothetical protein
MKTSTLGGYGGEENCSLMRIRRSIWGLSGNSLFVTGVTCYSPLRSVREMIWEYERELTCSGMFNEPVVQVVEC